MNINYDRGRIQQEAMDSLEAHGYNGAVILPTGTGKTFILIEALRRIYKPGMTVLYTCDSQRLRDTDFNNELFKWGAEEYVELIEKQCYASAYKKENQHYNVLLADEGDYAVTPEYSKLFLNNKFDHIIFVTAFLPKEKRAFVKEIVPIVYERKVKEIEEEKVVNKAQFWYVPYLLNKEENSKYLMYNKRFSNLLKQPNDKNRESRLNFLTFERLHFLAKLESSAYICKKLLAELAEEKKKRRTLIFCNSTEQADKISEHSYHGKNQSLDKLNTFNSSEINTLAVCGKIDRGVNLESVNTIILENLSRSETKAIQKIGRGKRLDVNDILDVFILIPYFKKEWGRPTHYPTIVLNKAQEACRNIGITNAKTYIVK